MIIVVTGIRTRPGDAGRFIRLAADRQAGCGRECAPARVELLRDRDDPDRFTLIEEFADAAALEAAGQDQPWITGRAQTVLEWRPGFHTRPAPGAGASHGPDPTFLPDAHDLSEMVARAVATPSEPGEPLPDALPEAGVGDRAALDWLAPHVLGGARRLGAAAALAHMDPPTPWVTWVAALWNASLNQNLLHPDVAPVARGLEARAIGWLAPAFGMDGGHMTPGSTVSNLTALWAARELRGVRTVIASEAAHLSVPKAAHLLGLGYRAIPTCADGTIDAGHLPQDMGDAVLVLTAGGTSTGAIDDMALAGRAAWTHVDAAWAGPLRFSARHAHRLDGIERADSVAVSAHKLLFQPKESGLVFFRDTAVAHEAISYGGAYLKVPNTGVLGSHGAIAVPLLATLMAWGRNGLAARIDRAMALADALHARLDQHPGIELFGAQVSGVVLWRPAGGVDTAATAARLPPGMASRTRVAGDDWIRHVAANPMADLELIWKAIEHALSPG